MDVLLLNTYDWGGAATATKRIHRGLRDIGVDSRMLVQHKRGDDPTIVGPGNRLRNAYSMARIVADPWPLKLFGGTSAWFSVNWLPDDVARQIGKLDPDLVHLNWVGENFFSPKSLRKFDRPIVWRLPDMWAMTGGCHYADGCERFTERCGACPQLGRDVDHDVTWWTHRRKRSGYADADITVVAPSTWLAEQAERSSLLDGFTIEVIPNGLDTATFEPYDAAIARDVFDIRDDVEVILTGAVDPTSNPRKGFDYLQRAVRSLAEERGAEDVEVVVFGADEPEAPPDFGFDTRYVGYLHDEASLAMLYAAADVMVVPSKYEGFGQTVTEAMACGTPVVAFDATGPSDTVVHGETGFLARPYDPMDLAEGIEWVLEGDRATELGARARERAVERYDIGTVAGRYRDLYEDILGA